MKKAFVIKDPKVLKACLDYSKALGLSVNQDNYRRESGEAISVGTSKKYTIGGNANPDFYETKHNLDLLDLDLDGAVEFVDSVNDLYESDYETIEIDATEVAEDEDDSGYNHEAINLIYAKIKKQGKNPSDYYVISDYSGEYTLTTNAHADNVVGNLSRIFSEIN